MHQKNDVGNYLGLYIRGMAQERRLAEGCEAGVVEGALRLLRGRRPPAQEKRV